MSTHRHFDKICCIALAATLLLTVLFVNAGSLGVKTASAAMGYESRLFDTASVHTIDIVMEDWDSFLDTCTNEEYSACTVLIDGEAYKNVGIRAKGNTSLTQVSAYGNDRYSFKVEFDCYDSAKSYYGLDKLCLNNIIQDNTYLKDFLTYQIMAKMGVPSPLCSFANITVNGKAWGLYLAIEGVEEAFLRRNYGKEYGNLYKPDSMNMGGGRGNGKDFKMDDWKQNPGNDEASEETDSLTFLSAKTQESASEPGSPPQEPGEKMPGGRAQNERRMGSDDVLLKYIDDTYDSYKNIFDNAKTNISDKDKERLIASLKNLSAGENIADTVDIEHVIRYFVAHNFVLNFDSYTGSMIHNYYLYETGGKLSMIPWDYNLAFGGFLSADDAESLVNYPIDSPISGGSTEDRPMIAWIFAKEEYTELYHQYFAELLSGYFDSGEFEEMIDAVKAMISPYVEEDPTKFCTYEEFITGIDTLKEFCLLRAKSIQGQLEGSIGATSETQSQDTLISAGDIKISDMGSMGNGRGGRAGFPEEADTPPGRGSRPMEDPKNPAQMPDAAKPDDTPFAKMPENAEPPSNMPGQNAASPPGIPQEESAGFPSPSSWLSLGSSAGILALGLLFALSFRRRR